MPAGGHRPHKPRPSHPRAGATLRRAGTPRAPPGVAKEDTWATGRQLPGRPRPGRGRTGWVRHTTIIAREESGDARPEPGRHFRDGRSHPNHHHFLDGRRRTGRPVQPRRRPGWSAGRRRTGGRVEGGRKVRRPAAGGVSEKPQGRKPDRAGYSGLGPTSGAIRPSSAASRDETRDGTSHQSGRGPGGRRGWCLPVSVAPADESGRREGENAGAGPPGRMAASGQRAAASER